MRGPIALAAVLVALALPASAQQAEPPALPGAEAKQEKPRKPAEIKAEQLDILFGRLHGSDSPASTLIEQKIWALWSSSDSPTAEVLLQQAQKAMDAGAPAQSLSILDRLIGAYPDFAEAWNKRATLYYLMKRDDDALKDIAKVLDLEPRHFGALAGRGMIYQRQKKYSLALDSFNEALAINPGLEQVKQAVKRLGRLEQGI